MSISSKYTKGFTIVELMVVIVVIAILASIVIVAYNTAQPAARDAERKADLHSIAEAIALYRQKYGNDIQTGSGCGAGGNGSGWFNYQGSYPKTILSCLTDVGYLDGGNSKFVDPSGCTTNNGNYNGSPLGYCHLIGGVYGYTYMKYSSGGGDSSVTCVYARLEREDDSATLKSSTNPCYSASSATAASYGMNYEVVAK